MNAILGISSEPNVVPLRFVGLAGDPFALARVLAVLADAHVELRSIVRSDDQLSLLVSTDSALPLAAVIAQLRRDGVAQEVFVGDPVAPVAVLGSHLRERSTIAARMFRALSREGINSECLSTSEARIWCLVGDADRHRALGALRDEFVEELRWLSE